MNATLGIDIGTYELKGVIVDFWRPCFGERRSPARTHCAARGLG